MILSSKNAFQEVKRLRKRDYRQQTGMVIAEGLPEVTRAVEAKTPIAKLFVCPELLDFDYTDIAAEERIEVSREEFAEIAFGARLKGILALCRPASKTLADLKLSTKPLVIVLEAVEKPGNLGAVIRSADGAGVDAVFVVDGKTDIYNQHVVRSSIGTVFHVPTVSVPKEEAVAFLKEKNIRLFAATARAKKKYTDCSFKKAAAILVGNEHNGLSDFLLKNADEQIFIPMGGEGGCLNVTVSASILLYEARRQRQEGIADE